MAAEDCGMCGKREHIIDKRGQELLEDFFQLLTSPFMRNFKSVTVWAHNLHAYDGQFLLKYMIETLEWTPEVILNGAKIEYMKYSHLKFKDSLNFFHSALSSFPKMMGLDNIVKGKNGGEGRVTETRV